MRFLLLIFTAIVISALAFGQQGAVEQLVLWRGYCQKVQLTAIRFSIAHHFSLLSRS